VGALKQTRDSLVQVVSDSGKLAFIRSSTCSSQVVKVLVDLVASVSLFFWMTIFKIPANFRHPTQILRACDPEVSLKGSIGSLIAKAVTSSHEPFRRAFVDHLKGPLSSVEGSRGAIGQSLGDGFIGLARLLWSLYVPNIPIDPAAASRSRHAYLARWERIIITRGEIEYRSNLSEYGLYSSGKIESLLEDLSRVRNLLGELDTVDTQRPLDPAALEALFSELHTSVRHLISEGNLRRLAKDLQKNWSPSVATRVTNLRDSLTALVHRLNIAYGQFDDMLRPIRLSLAAWSIGFSFLLGAARQRATSAAPYVSYAAELIQFPAISSTSLSHDIDLPSSAIDSPARAALLRVLAVDYEVACSRVLSTRHVARLRDVYGHLHYLWAVERQRDEDERKLAQSLYRTRNQGDEIIDEEEEEEKEFWMLFPQYEEEDSPTVTSKAPARSFTPRDVSSLVGAHHRLFQSTSGAKVETSHPFLAARSDVASHLLPSFQEFLPEEFEAMSVSHRLDLLLEATSPLSPTTGVVNFYTDANVSETQNVVPMIDSLVDQLKTLIERWPDQMVLQDLLERCRAILAIPSSAPVARFLTALELLLPKVDDWQSYASREVSLQKHQDAIISRVVEWRRLELSSWSRLLEMEQAKFEERVGEWWFRFYETVARVHNLESSSPEATTFFRDLVSLLGEFVSGAPVGQYTRRMRLLASFAEYCRRLSSLDDQTNPLLSALATVLDNVYCFYDQFRGAILSFVTTERAKIEGEVKDVMRLASWKDINVYALKQSAQKSHRQLHKCVRKFRQVLQHPVANFITISHMAALPPVDGSLEDHRSLAEDVATGVPTLPSDFAPASSASQHLVSLQQTLGRLSDLTSGRLHASLGLSRHAPLDELVTEIVTASDELRRESPPASEAKQVKALLSRKRRAWADLLKELRRIGLTANPSADVVERQRDAAFVHRSGKLQLLPRSASFPAAQSCDSYFWRLLVLLPQLRGMVGAHHDDIASRDFQKLLGYVESANGLLLNDRRHLAESLCEQHKIRQMLDNLAKSTSDSMLSEPQPPESAATTARKLLEITGQVISAVREACESAGRHATLSDDVAEDLQRFKSELSGSMEAIEPMATELKATVDILDERLPSITSTSELALFKSVSSELNSISSMVQKVAVEVPSFAYLSSPLSRWIQGRLSDLSSSVDAPPPVSDVELWDRHAAAVDSVLVITKELHTDLPIQATAENGDVRICALTREKKKLIYFFVVVSSCPTMVFERTFLPFAELFQCSGLEKCALSAKSSSRLFFERLKAPPPRSSAGRFLS
jgi:midasin